MPKMILLSCHRKQRTSLTISVNVEFQISARFLIFNSMSQLGIPVAFFRVVPVSHVSLRCPHIVVRLPSPCRSCNTKISKSHHQLSHHDLFTNSTSFSVGLDLEMISFASAAF